MTEGDPLISDDNSIYDSGANYPHYLNLWQSSTDKALFVLRLPQLEDKMATRIPTYDDFKKKKLEKLIQISVLISVQIRTI